MADGTTRKKQEEGDRQGVRGTVARISPRKQAASTNLTSMPQEGTKSSERSEQDMQRDKGTHDHMRETGLTVVTRRSLRALADALRKPASSVLLVRGLELTLALLGEKRESTVGPPDSVLLQRVGRILECSSKQNAKKHKIS